MSSNTTVSILRPSKANKNNLFLQQYIHDSDLPKEECKPIADDASIFELQREVQLSDTLREIIEWTAHHQNVPVEIQEYQIRRRENRDCYTHDLEQPGREGALKANIITFEDPNLGQIKFIKDFMRYALCQRCIILFREDERLDDYIADLGLTQSAGEHIHHHFPDVLIDNGFDVISAHDATNFAWENRRRKIILADQRNEDRVEQAVSTALQSLRN